MPVVIKLDLLPKHIAAVERGLPLVIEKAVVDLEAHMKEAMASSPASGRTYHGHQASAPGEPPAVDTGALVNGITHQAEGLHGSVDIPSPGQYLDLGTRKMAPRPFTAPAVTAVVPSIETALSELIQG